MNSIEPTTVIIEDEMPNFTNYPAIFSAVAAISSAIAAWFSFLINRRNASDSVRPQLVLEGWGLREGNELTHIIVGSVKNVGRGPALYLSFDGRRSSKEHKALFLIENIIDMLNVGEEKVLNGEVDVSWDDEEIKANRRLDNVLIEISYRDIREFYHTLTLSVYVSPGRDDLRLGNELAPGLFYTGSGTITKPAWRVHSETRLKKIIKRIIKSGWWVHSEERLKKIIMRLKQAQIQAKTRSSTSDQRTPSQ